MNRPMTALVMPQLLFDAMLAHVRSDRSQEMCGLLAGEGQRVTGVRPVPNALHDPYQYRMDGQEFVDALVACNWEPLGVYHSHLNGPPTPSATDVSQATLPDSFYVIVSFHVAPPTVRVFRIAGGKVSETEITTKDE